MIAIGHSLLKSVYHILTDNVSYKELGADYLNAKLEEKRRKYLKNELQKLGYDVQIKAKVVENAAIETINQTKPKKRGRPKKGEKTET